MSAAVKQQPLRRWRVVVRGCDIGSVNERSEELARCAALSRFGFSEDEAQEGVVLDGIGPMDDFEVRPA